MKPFLLYRSLLSFLLFIFFLAGGCSLREAPPPVVSLLPYPSVTHHPIFSLRGTKTPGTAILINNQMVIPFDGDSFWSGEVNLIPGNNPLFIKSVNQYGNESAPLQINVTLNTTPPSAPVMTPPLSSGSLPVLIQGTKDPDADVLLIGKEIVSFTSSNSWSYTYSPLQGTMSLQFSSKNRLGNESSKTTFTLTYNGPSAPALKAPLDGETFKYAPGIFNSLLFSWTSTLSPTFKIQIASTPDFSSPTINTNILSNPYSLNLSGSPSPLSPGVYFWRVGAYDSSGNLFYSPSRKFFYGKITGDFNGDGFSDILVGAEGTTGPGKVYLFFGGPNPTGGTFTPKLTPDLTLSGENGGDLFGTALAAGDLNGDGYDDIIVGAYHNTAGGERAGRVYIYFGGPNLHTTPDMILTGFAAGEQFGVSVASGQDINRDGYDDLLVGANLNSLKGQGTGRAYLFLGRAVLSPFPDMVFNGEAPGDHFGISVTLAGDINGDGFSDFLIGAGGDGSSTHIGKAYLYYGEFELGNQPQMIFAGNSPGDAFGHLVNGVKDINGDGFDDFIIGAPLHPGLNGEVQEGTADLYYGGPNLKITPDLTLYGSGALDQFGFSAASIGDIPPKDGHADFIVGAYGGSPGGVPFAGWAEIFKGNSNPTQANMRYNLLYSGNNISSESFSSSLSSPGDFNGDGYPDLIIGAFRADQSKGRAYYYDGLSLANPLPCSICMLSGTAAQEGFGIAVH